VVLLVVGTLTWHPWDRGQSGSQAQDTSTPALPSSPTSALSPQIDAPAPVPPSPVIPGLPSADSQPVDPATTGPADGSSCNHAQLNNTTISNSGSIVRCVSGPGGFSWQPDTGEQVDPIIVGQQGWDACLKSSSQAQCVRAAVAVAGGIYPAGPVYPPGTYSVPGAIPYGTYGASIDYGTGKFSNGITPN